jgi:methylated-DNA-protein-cysteine methyltransferase-like protein
LAWEAVFALVKRVPKGRVITYGQVARAIKLRGGARAAGYAMAACPKGRGIPWHRVVGAGGRILLGEPRASLQRRLLESEGIEFRGGRLELDGREWLPPARRKRARRTAR